MRRRINISVVVPVYNEQDSLDELHKRLRVALCGLKKNYEIIFIDDGSTDDSFRNLLKIYRKNKNKVCLIRFRKNLGKSMALAVGFNRAKGKYVITIDADLQDDPKEIEKIIAKLHGDIDVVSGWKKNRQDPWSKKLSSYIFNLITSLMMNYRIHDINCGLKGYKQEVIKEIEIYGDLYRFLPLLAKKAGFKIAEIPVRHHKRKFGKSKYGWKRIISASVDLFTVLFLTNFRDRPAHFFGITGFGFFIIGMIADGYVTLLKIATGSTQGHTPLLLFGMLMIIVGIQLISLGFLGELFSSAVKQKTYIKYSINEKLSKK